VLAVAGALVSIFLIGTGSVLAATFTVNSPADTAGAECASVCTLRGAIAQADKSADAGSTILVPAGTYELGAFEEAHPTTTGQLRLTNPAGTTVRIEGAGVGTTIIDAAKHDRVLRVGGGGEDVLEGLTLEEGFPGGNEKDNAFEESVRGGGIYQAGGTLTLDRVRLTADGNSGYGGGIDVEGDGTLRLIDSELDHDFSTSGGGGGISVESGTLEASGTTFTVDDSESGQGGAIQLRPHTSGQFVDDTFAGDGFNGLGDTYEGGGAYLEDASASFTNVTFAGDYGLGFGGGGADVNANNGSHVTFVNTLLGLPIGGEPGEVACYTFEAGSGVTWTDDGGNLGGDGSCHLAPADMERTLDFGELGAYGGPTPTVPLLEGSPAIDFGVAGCPAADQREYARVGNCDSGAFEFSAVPPTGGGTPGGSSESPAPGGTSSTTSGGSATGTSATAPAGTAGIATTPAAVEELLLGCGKTQLVLNDAYIHGGRVLLSGSAAKSLAGKQVKILFNERKTVATATVTAGGQFTTTAPLPPAKIREALTTRYTAEIGKVRSLHLKLTRRLLLEPPKASGTTVTLTGQVTLPLTKPIAPVTVEQQLQCGKATVVKTFTPPAGGRFQITLTVPANAKAAIYRLTSKVAANKHSTTHGFTTFSLPLPVTLG
jgi:CSLREA domain-containing protein